MTNDELTSSEQSEPLATSPAASGPAGPLFEGQVGAHYLLSILAGGEPRGLSGSTVRQIEFQRASDGNPLDDVIVRGSDAQGKHTLLEIQVKRTVDFTASDVVFREVVAQLAQAAAKPDFSSTRYELAVAIERTSTKIEREYKEVLSWARNLESAATFRAHIDRLGFGTSDMRKFVGTFRKNLALCGSPDDDQTVWSILRRFQILVFDFNQPGSASQLLAHERCQMVLSPRDGQQAASLWNTLSTVALESAGKGGELTATSLRERLVGEHSFTFAGDRNLSVARERLHEASQAALLDIATSVGGVHLDRTHHAIQIHGALDAGRYVEIRGLSGVGKSGVLRHLAEQIALEAKIIVLNPDRTIPGGWLALASTLDCAVSARDFLSDLASDGGTVLFIDGIDTFEDDAQKATIRDLVQAAAQTPNVSVVVTARESFGRDEPSWLPKAAIDILTKAPTVAIDGLNEDEINQLKSGDPALASLLADAHPAREVIRNLFRLARLVHRDSANPMPRTEAEMAIQWWRNGDGPLEGRRERQRILRALGGNILKGATSLDSRLEPPSAVQSLIESSSVRELRPDLIVFQHDVLRDWAIGSLLFEDASLLSLLSLDKPAQATYVRGVEIAARLSVEESQDEIRWTSLLDQVSKQGVHGSWRRAVLLALVRSESGLAVLDRVSVKLWESDGRLLIDLLRITAAIESTALTELYSGSGIDGSHLPSGFMVPGSPSWSRLIVWTHSRIKSIPKAVIPDLFDFYSKWCMGLFGNDGYTPYLVEHFFEWLVEIETALNPEHFSGLRRPFGLNMTSDRERDLEASLRMMFLAFSRVKPALAEKYLNSVAARRPGNHIAREIMKFRGTATQVAPKAVADLTLRTLIPEQDDDESFRRSRPDIHGPFEDDSSYAPPSPAHGPFLDLLTCSPKEGLRVIRGLVEFAVSYFSQGQSPGANVIEISFPDGKRTFAWKQSYNWSRGGGHSSLLTSALMALEAWSHKRVETGESVATVIADILNAPAAPTALLLVAVDVLLSHWPASASDAIPFLGCPELLSLDRERYAHDFQPPDEWGTEPKGAANRKSLHGRPSRRVSLYELIGHYTIGQPSLLPELQAQLAKASKRVGDPDGTTNSMRDVRFAAAHAVNLANKANWITAPIQKQDGSIVNGYQYKAPPEEEAASIIAETRSKEATFITFLRASLPIALSNPAKSSPDLIREAVSWAQKVDLSVDIEQNSDRFDKEDWRRQARVTAAVLAMRDGDDALWMKEKAWAEGILIEALRAETDPYAGFQQIPFNPIAIAAVGMIHLSRREKTEAKLQILLGIAARADYAMLPAFKAEIRTLSQIDERLPHALMRIGFATSIQALHKYDESEDANKARASSHRERIHHAVEKEMAWLQNGGEEPDWPSFPIDSPRAKKRHYIRYDTTQFTEEDVRPKRPDDIVEPKIAAGWIDGAIPLLNADSLTWFRKIVAIYAEWTLVLNGKGLSENDDSEDRSTDWNFTYFDLLAQTIVGTPLEEVKRDVLRPICALPDEGFFEVASAFLRSMDELYFNAKVFEPEQALEIRSLISKRLEQSRHWKRAIDRPSPGLEMHLSHAVVTLFFHNGRFAVSKTYLNPPAADRLKVFIPLLGDISLAAAASEYIAVLFMGLLELRVQPEHVSHLVRCATGWLEKYPDSTTFWIQHGMGNRICAWLSEALRTEAEIFASPSAAGLDELLDALLRLGVAAAKLIESSLVLLRQPGN